MIKILHQDPYLIAIEKPPGLPSQPTMDPRRPNALDQLKSQLGREVFLHHRLDRDTSGVMIFGLDKKINPALTNLFREHQIQKKYVCIVKMNKETLPTEFQVQNHLAPIRDQNKKLMRMVSVKTGGWAALTLFQVMQLHDSYALIQAVPKTGRTHQIRIHLAEMKCPILGDPLYGGKSSLVPRLMLHASSIEFEHPITKQNILIKCEYPKDFTSVMSHLQL